MKELGFQNSMKIGNLFLCSFYVFSSSTTALPYEMPIKPSLGKYRSRDVSTTTRNRSSIIRYGKRLQTLSDNPKQAL
jgi:hypothetical protein